MHELGIVYEIIKTVREVQLEEHLEQVTAVTLQIGEFSGVIPSYLTECWKALQPDSGLPQMEMRTELLPAIAVCTHCCHLYAFTRHARCCPYCGSRQYEILTGHEFNIKSIEAY